MPNVVRTDIDALNAVLTVKILKEDYLPKVKKDVKNFTQRTPMKGFRPGKTPPKLVQSMYGTEFMMEAVNKTLQDALNDYLQAEKPEIFGQPIGSAEQPDFKFDPKNPSDFSMDFDLGLMPTFDVKGLDNITYDRYVVQVDPTKIDAELENRRKQGGETKEVEDAIQANDMIYLHAQEHGGSFVKEDLTLSMNWLNEEMQDVFKTQKVGDHLTVNIFQLEKETTPQYVRKYFLGIEDEDDRTINENFDVKITKVTRVVPATFDEEFFQKNFGVATEEEARTQINSTLGGNYTAQADALLIRDFQMRLMEENKFDLPDAFLKRWLVTQNEKNTPEAVEQGYEVFAENMRWTLVRSKVAKESGVQVNDEDLKEYYRNKVRGYLGGMAIDDAFIESLVERVFDDEKQFGELYEDVITEKTFDAMKQRATIADKPVSSDEFDSIMAAARAEAALRRGDMKEELPAGESEIEEIVAEEV
ncbi:MAG: trigger factor [Saprospiraceae bacterium]|nr:trigger factor [Saprospiraceae bacterium]